MSSETRVFITGAPGVGKSRVFNAAIELLRKLGIKLGGIATPEVRNKVGRRTGFKVVDLASGKEGWLASTKPPGRRFGKYFVKIEEFEGIASPALDHALKTCDVVGVDELGRMEFFSQAFKEKISEALACGKPLLATLHRALAREYEKFGGIIEVTAENRGKLPEEIALKFLQHQATRG